MLADGNGLDIADESIMQIHVSEFGGPGQGKQKGADSQRRRVNQSQLLAMGDGKAR